MEIQKYNLTKEDLNKLSQAGIIPKGTPVSQVEIFAEACRQRGISPFLKHIYLMYMGGKYISVVGIDGFRFIASKSGAHAGTDDVLFNGSMTLNACIKAGLKQPHTAQCTVYKIVAGQRYAFTKSVRFNSFAGSNKWKTMPFHMLAKVAESHALKMAFPEYLSGLYVPEERSNFNNENQAIQELPQISKIHTPKTMDEYKALIDAYTSTVKLKEDSKEILNSVLEDFDFQEVDDIKEYIRNKWNTLKLAKDV